MDKRTNEQLAQALEREAVAFDYTAAKNECAMVLGRDARDLAALMREAGRRLSFGSASATPDGGKDGSAR